MQEAAPYSILAAAYDVVMEHVDYQHWALHIHRLLQIHHPQADTVLELGCGTGSLALVLQPHGSYHYVATDRSPQMIRVAQAKAEEVDLPIRYGVADFTDYEVTGPVDAVLLLYDGLNYLLNEEAIRALMQCTYRALRPGGVFIFDQSTLANSLRNAQDFEEEREVEGLYYQRRSTYDATRRLHTTTFDIHVGDRHYREQHVQRAYDEAAIRRLMEAEGFTTEAAYDGFSTEPAHDASERIHWVARRPATR